MSATLSNLRSPRATDSVRRAGGARWPLAALAGMSVAAVLALALDFGGAPAASGSSAQAPKESDVERAPVENVEASPRVEREAAALHSGSSAAVALDDGALPRSPRPADRARWSEADFYAELSALADARAFDAAIAAALDAARPAAERFAALRASYDRRAEGSGADFLRAARELADTSEANSASTPRASIHWLAARAAREPAAREVLEQMSFASEVNAELRAASACALVLAAPDADLERLEQRFSRDREERVVLSAKSALNSRRRDADTLEQAPQEP